MCPAIHAVTSATTFWTMPGGHLGQRYPCAFGEIEDRSWVPDPGALPFDSMSKVPTIPLTQVAARPSRQMGETSSNIFRVRNLLAKF